MHADNRPTPAAPALDPPRAGTACPTLAVVAAVAWLFAVGAGITELWRHVNTPGTPGTPPATWPPASALDHDPERPTLVVVVDSRCRCTHATLHELGMLLAKCHGRVAVHVLVTGAREDPHVAATAAQLPDVQVRTDAGGHEARHFGAFTSGAVALYSAQGRRLFHGGITGGRGHRGDNAGRDAVVGLVLGKGTRTPSAPVFGCSLCDAVERPPAEQSR